VRVRVTAELIEGKAGQWPSLDHEYRTVGPRREDLEGGTRRGRRAKHQKGDHEGDEGDDGEEAKSLWAAPR
jgi:hypothetical protein